MSRRKNAARAARLLAVLTSISTVAMPFRCAFATDLPSNLNLGATTKSAVAPQMSGNGSAVILIGGKPMIVSSGQAVTPAQAAAVQQVLDTGKQSLILGILGNATGGSLVLPGSQSFLNLTNAANVTLIRDFAGNCNMNLLGNLVNAGKFYAVSTDANTTNAIITAQSISNLTNALLTTVLPAGGLDGFGNAIGNLGLTLHASEKIVNAGTISSAANLNLSAPVIDGHGGTFSALNGAINIDHGGANHLLVTGGSFLAPIVNADAGCGNISFGADAISGVLNVHAGSGSAGAMSDLTLGVIDISGDPTFWTNGNLIAGGSLTNIPEALTLLAGQDINLGNFSFQTNGFNITMIAGTKLTPSPGAVNPLMAGQTITSNGPSATGGKITCNGCTISTVNLGGAGADILLAAYDGPTAGSGSITLTNGIVNASAGIQNLKAGNITIIAPNTISFGIVGANSGGPSAPAGPTINIVTARPTGTITADSTGAITAGSITHPLFCHLTAVSI